MISADIRFEGFDVRSWTRVIELLCPHVEAHPESGEPSRYRGTLILVDDANRRILSAHHTLRGPLPELHGQSSARTLADFVERYGARRVLIVREGALDALADALADGLTAPPRGRSSRSEPPSSDDAAQSSSPRHEDRGAVVDLSDAGDVGGHADGQQGMDGTPNDGGTLRATAEPLAVGPGAPRGPRSQANTDSFEGGYITQWLVLLRAIRRQMSVGNIRLWPNPTANVPVPHPRMMRRAANLALPDNRAAVMVLFDRGRVHTAAVVRRQLGMIDLVSGPDRIIQWTGPLGGDWRRDHRVMLDAVARHVAPVHVGLFAEVDAVRRALRSGRAGSWAREVALREVVFHPMPRTLKMALGADALRGLRRSSYDVFGGVDIVGLARPVLRHVRARWSEVRSVSEELGFDPLMVLATLLREDPKEPERARQEEEPSDPDRPLSATPSDSRRSEN